MQDGVGCQKQRLLTPSPELPVGVAGGHIRGEMQESVGIFNLGSQSKISVAKLMCISEHSMNYSFIAKSPYFVLQWNIKQNLFFACQRSIFGKKIHGSQYYSIEFLSAMACRKFADTLRNAGVLSEKSSGMSHLSHLPPSLLPSFQEMVRILLKSHICGNSALFGNFQEKKWRIEYFSRVQEDMIRDTRDCEKVNLQSEKQCRVSSRENGVGGAGQVGGSSSEWEEGLVWWEEVELWEGGTSPDKKARALRMFNENWKMPLVAEMGVSGGWIGECD